MLAVLHLEDREEVTCLNDVMLLGRHYIAVGTAVFPSDEDYEDYFFSGRLAVASKAGRMLLIEPTHQASADHWDIKIITFLKTPGPVHDTAIIHGFLALAAASQVCVYRISMQGVLIAAGLHSSLRSYSRIPERAFCVLLRFRRAVSTSGCTVEAT